MKQLQSVIAGVSLMLIFNKNMKIRFLIIFILTWESNSLTQKTSRRARNTNGKPPSVAQKAAQEAKAASDAQNIAGAQAAHQVKAELAQKALEAAKVVEVELSGKEAIVSQLQQEVNEAEAVMREEMGSIHQSKTHMEGSVQAARQAEQELKALSQALQAAQSNLQNAERGAQGSQRDFIEKQHLIQAAKHRLSELLKRFKCAKADLDTTKQAVQKANAAAHQAKANAGRNKRQPYLQLNMR